MRAGLTLVAAALLASSATAQYATPAPPAKAAPAPPAAKAAPEPRPVTATILGEQALLGMQIAMRQQRKQNKVSQALADCVGRLPRNSFTALFDTMLTEALTPQEKREADVFHASAVGQKLARMARAQNYTNAGETPPEAAPQFTPAESNRYAQFVGTAAGDKLFTRRVLESTAARQKIVNRIDQLLKSCEGAK